MNYTLKTVIGSAIRIIVCVIVGSWIQVKYKKIFTYYYLYMFKDLVEHF